MSEPIRGERSVPVCRNGGRLREYLRAATSAFAIVAITFCGYQLHFTTPTAALLFLGVIVWQALAGRLGSAVLISVVAGACLDFFFLPPPLTLYIEGPLNVLAFVVFLAMALIITLVITRLLSRLRAESDRVRNRGNNLEQLYDLARQLLLVKPDRMARIPLLKTFREKFAARAVCLFDAENADLHKDGTSLCNLPDLTKQAYILGEDMEDSRAGITVRCFRVGKTITGAIGFDHLPDAEWTAGPLSVLAAAAIEQARIFRQASQKTAAAQAEVFRTAILDALAHEFKTPLATILAVAGGMRGSPRLEADEQEMAAIIESEAARLSALASRLLRVARLDREEVKPCVQHVDISAMAESLAQRFAGQCGDREIAVSCLAEACQATVDRELLDLALTQLLDNAVKYSTPGSAIAMETSAEGGFIAIRVRNEGSSVAPHERDLIFERFYRGTDVRKLISGTGLGLYIARKIAVAHGGSLGLENSSSAHAVAFCLKLPERRNGNHRLTTNN
jgi:two-component system, OmpR family, sensor histidine kinase KdpD